LDTNGCQGHVRRRFPEAAQDLYTYKEQLTKSLAESKADWKFVFGHHPLYTKGLEHGTLGRCLRADTYHHRGGESKGYGLEETFSTGGVHGYFSGHEHVLQHHFAKNIHHFVVGGTGAQHSDFYGGIDESQEIDWFKLTEGFLVGHIQEDIATISFIDLHANEIEKVVIKRNTQISKI